MDRKIWRFYIVGFFLDSLQQMFDLLLLSYLGLFTIDFI